MARWLLVASDTVTNIIESPAAPDLGPGETAYVAVTGAESVGDNLLLVLWYVKLKKQAALDAFAPPFCDLFGLIKAGTTATLTGANVSAFLASVNNNYRAKRTLISAAATVVVCNAIDVTAGWPVNP